MASRDSVVTRSRTNLFLSFRDSAARPSVRLAFNRYGREGAEETEALMDGDAAVAIDMPSAPPAWLVAAMQTIADASGWMLRIGWTGCWTGFVRSVRDVLLETAEMVELLSSTSFTPSTSCLASPIARQKSKPSSA